MSMDNPRYQRLQQRLATLRPEQRAILSTAQNELTGQVAQDDARNELTGRKTAMQEQGREQGLGLQRDSLALNQEISRGQLDLGRDQFSAGKKDLRRAELLGLANVGISGGLGYLDKQRAEAEDARVAARARKLLSAMEGL
ncbi:hypothetical protein [Desulfocurvibacter africanus]|uniref:Uncharacterized protein n=1 Tax=Desulfocurvibacter africanus subsp. africanus str. Walvis Bay TaxID=690850 RepID=F3YXF0_DESAF|nr:hypothetical protein [Desulfocurvibacter africanus]EGJ51727.1 hypothetical protein Desaf_3441 [Desulfocurvibacter africanus subsp. africanus str. Walvis Bay]